MPLPDERPRQSVANLIGKFETQTKRLSLSASSPSRSSSVVSHITGDSTKEELKERREWPPRSVTDAASKQPPSSYSRHVPPPLITSSLSNTSAPPGDIRKLETSGAEVGEAEVPLTAKALNASQRQVKAEPNSFLENWRKDLPSPSAQELPTVPDTAKPDPVLTDSKAATPTLSTAKKSGTPSTPRSSGVASKAPVTRATTTSKPVASAASRTPVKSVLKSPSSRQSLASPAAQPLKPQHTGHSVASSATTKRPATKPVAPVSSKTPARPDAASRSKTPTSSRPKTPSSGLFAPTAASLAKSRNPPPAVPTLVKKTHLSSSSMDRLSKPTAASQARMATVTATPSRPAAAAPRTVVKPKTPATSKPQPRKETAIPRVPTAAVVAASVASIGLAVAAAEEQIAKEIETEGVVESDDNEHSGGEVVHSETVDSSNDVTKKPEAAVSEQLLGEEEVASAEDRSVTPRSPSPSSVLQSTPEPGHDIDTGNPEGSREAEAADLETSQEPSIEHRSGDDLEDIVNLLESVTISKPPADATNDIPDELLEIPDEEEK